MRINEKTQEKLSGPVSAYVTNYLNKSYNFFGDSHYGMEKNCSPCQDIRLSDLELVSPQGSDNCWDISVLLSKIFTEASEKGVWVDFYLEIPFISQNKYHPSEKGVFKQVDDYLYKLYYIFYNCLNKLNCKYDTTRFHYVDIRLKYKKLNLEELTNEMEQLTGKGKQEFLVKINNFENYISVERITNSLQVLQRMVLEGKKNKTFIYRRYK